MDMPADDESSPRDVEKGEELVKACNAVGCWQKKRVVKVAAAVVRPFMLCLQ
jgi:hypothetical protein